MALAASVVLAVLTAGIMALVRAAARRRGGGSADDGERP